MAEVVIATKNWSKFQLHQWVENGGTIKFTKYNFAVRIAGKGDIREIKLVTFPEGETFSGSQVHRGAPKAKKKKTMVIEEDDTEELA